MLTELGTEPVAPWLGKAHVSGVFLVLRVKQGGGNGEETAPETVGGKGRIITRNVSTVMGLFSPLTKGTLRVSRSAWK